MILFLKILINVFTAIAVASFAYGVVKVMFLTKYADYQERMLQSYTARSSMMLIIDPLKLQHITMLLCGGLFLLGVLLGGSNVFAGMFLGCILLVPGLLAPRIVLMHMLNKRLEKIVEQLPTGLDLLANSMRAGLTFSLALERNLELMPKELGEELAVVLHEFRLGSSLSDALMHWSDRIKLPDVKLISTTAILSLRCGASLADSFQSLSEMIRARATFHKEVNSLTAEGKFQAILMTALPFALMLIMTILNRETMLSFYTNTIGQILVAVMVLMQIIAYFWIRKLVALNL
jgi:tight adherence protein B